MKIILSILTVILVAMPCFAGNIGTTSEWKVVYTACAWCGTTNGNLEIHHVYPQHVYPEYAHDTNRMVCFCRRCHFTVGHKNNWTNVFLGVTNVIREGKK
jgi:hypothetical protein